LTLAMMRACVTQASPQRRCKPGIKLDSLTLATKPELEIRNSGQKRFALATKLAPLIPVM